MQVLTIQHVTTIQVKVHRIALLVSVMVGVQAAIVVLLDLQLEHHHHQVGTSFGNVIKYQEGPRRHYSTVPVFDGLFL
jgi:hypothetical protein